MNPKQLFGLAGGFFVVYIVITLTNKPHVPQKDAARAPGAAQRADEAAPAGHDAPSNPGGPVGFCLPGIGADTLSGADADAMIAALPGKAGWVAISPALFQADGYAVAVAADPQQTPTDASLTHAIQAAHAQGLQVLLRPVVVAKDGARRERFTPSDPSAWFKSYAQAVSPWVDLAEKEHVEVLSLGANYAQIEAGVPWDELAQQVRERYHGKLTYGAGLREESGNGGYQKVAFWKALDYVGFEAPLPDSVGAAGDESAMAAAWSDGARSLSDWMNTNQAGRQAIFTSVGYSPSSTDPGAAFRSFREAYGSSPWLAAANWYEYRADLETPRRAAAPRDGAPPPADGAPPPADGTLSPLNDAGAVPPPPDASSNQ